MRVALLLILMSLAGCAAQKPIHAQPFFKTCVATSVDVKTDTKTFECINAKNDSHYEVQIKKK
jgi:hypothetical protein